MKQSTKPAKIDVSYELYRELAGEICSPIDDSDLTHDLRYELYTSKLTYLYNIQEQCFRCINAVHAHEESFTQDDLLLIQNAIEITKDFLRQTIREALRQSLNSAEKKAMHAARKQHYT